MDIGDSRQVAYGKIARSTAPAGRAATKTKSPSWVAASAQKRRNKWGTKYATTPANTGNVVSKPYFDQVRQAHVSNPHGADGRVFAEMLGNKDRIRLIAASCGQHNNPKSLGTIAEFMADDHAGASDDQQSQTEEEPWNCIDLPGPFPPGEELYAYSGGCARLVIRLANTLSDSAIDFSQACNTINCFF
jgi:hypothetical protein